MTTLLRLLKVIALSTLIFLSMSTAHATNCPHTVDIFLTDPDQRTVPLTSLRNKVIPRGNVTLTGMMLFDLRIDYFSGGDSCIVTFESAGTSRNIGGGMTLTWGKAFVLHKQLQTQTDLWIPNNHSIAGCGELFPTHNSRYKNGKDHYKWNGSIASIKPTNQTDYMAYETYCQGKVDRFWVPFTIQGNYTGDTMSFKPFPAAAGPFSNIQWNKLGWYVIAAGESSARFNPNISFWSNSSSTAPLVLQASGCASSSLTPSQNSATYTTQSNLSNGSSVELAKFTTSRSLSNCAFASGDTIHFDPRLGNNSPFELTSSTTLSNTKSEEVYKFKCLNCADTSQFEKIEMRITRTLSGRKADNSSCDMQSSVAASRIIAASNLSTCTSLKLETEVRFVQTGNLLNPQTSSDQSNLQPIYNFTKADIGRMVFTSNTSTPLGSTDDLAKSDMRFTAPIVTGCADLASTYENSLPEVIKGLLNPEAGISTSIGSFKTTTKANKCSLKNTDSVTVGPFVLPSGTPLTLVSTTAVGVKTLVRTYQMDCNTCSDTKKTENIVFKVTQTLDASKGSLACSQTSSTQNSTLKMSNLQGCDTINLVNQVELLQNSPMLGQQPYDFASPLATFDVSIPLVGAQDTSTIGLSNKAFQLVAPLPKPTEVCKVVIKSAIQRR